MKLIQNQTKLFAWIDPDFDNWDIDEGVTTPHTLTPKDLEKNATFKEIYNPETDCVSQENVIEWVEKNKETILSSGKYYFFLLKNTKGSLFVARVFKIDGALRVNVHKFSDDYVWYAEYGNVFVFPQQDPSALKPKSLGSSDSLTLAEKSNHEIEVDRAIKICKANGFEVFKKM